MADGRRRPAPSGRWRCRPSGFLPALVLSLSPAVWLLDGAAGRPAPLGALDAGGRRRLVLGLRLSSSPGSGGSGRPSWSRPTSSPGRCPSGCSACRPCSPSSRPSASPRARPLAARPGPHPGPRVRADGRRMAARPPVHGLSLEHPRHGARPESLADAGRRPRRPLRPDGSPSIGAAPPSWRPRRGRRDGWAPALAAALSRRCSAFGALRVPAGAPPAVEGVRLRIMQPNLPQDAKFRPQNAAARSCSAISRSATGRRGTRRVGRRTHVIWPESAFPFLLHRDPQALAQIAALLPPGVTLVTGAARMDEPLPGRRSGGSSTPSRSSPTTARSRRLRQGASGPVRRIRAGPPRRGDPGGRPAPVRPDPGGFEPSDRVRPLAVPGLPPWRRRSATRRSSRRDPA